LGALQRLRSPAHLFDHLQALHRVLTLPAVVPVISSRGGDRATRRLVEARDALLAATRENAGHPEVRTEAEAREVIEAARLASRRLGLPSIADAFRLTQLAPWRTRRKPGAPEPDAPPRLSPPPSSRTARRRELPASDSAGAATEAAIQAQLANASPFGRPGVLLNTYLVASRFPELRIACATPSKHKFLHLREGPWHPEKSS
jgi:hypothetical protein